MTEASSTSRVGIYVRESRDDNGENIETIENQRDLLLRFVETEGLGRVVRVYTDDNVSGSAFERAGLDKLRSDVCEGSLDLLLLKDLSRLGRNNAKTLLFLDFLEENGVRIITSDRRYDSHEDNDTVGIETWFNERYVRDISRKIRASLKLKIDRGEYLGHAPYGYTKSSVERNRLCIDGDEAEVVKQIFRLYRSGQGYASIAKTLNGRGLTGPGGGKWNQAAVRRILCSRVYTGATVQGVSEKVSFKSKKTRRLPKERWVVTEKTHEAVITGEEFEEARNIREGRGLSNSPHKGAIHPLKGLLFCGGCGSLMYSRTGREGGTAYICGRYYRLGRSGCTSHFIYESAVLDCIAEELSGLYRDEGVVCLLKSMPEIQALFRDGTAEKASRMDSMLAAKLRQQEMLYTDRLEGRIGEQLFTRMNSQLEARIDSLSKELERLAGCTRQEAGPDVVLREMSERLEAGNISNGMARLIMKRATIYEGQDTLPSGQQTSTPSGPHAPLSSGHKQAGKIVIIDFRINKV